MKLASLKIGGRDGTLVMVNSHLSHYIEVTEVATTLQEAVENWRQLAEPLAAIYNDLNQNKIDNAKQLNTGDLASPLPRAFAWLDGSAYLSHVERVRKARGAEMPPSFLTDPLMYQGGSDIFLGPNDPIQVAEETSGIDCESEVAIITDDVPMGITADNATEHILLIMLVNDISLRNLIPNELAKGFGFLHGKPPSAFSPVAITPNELGEAWQDSKACLPLLTKLNHRFFGNPDAGIDMQFSFSELISHAAKTRPLGAGTIIGSGTVSNKDLSRGCSCLAERRVLEIIDKGEATTPFMTFGDQVQIQMLDNKKQNLFGTIDQVVKPCRP